MKVKEKFKLERVRKSQAKNVCAWYWVFRSVVSSRVIVEVTTYGPLPHYPDEQPVEDDAWAELEKSLS